MSMAAATPALLGVTLQSSLPVGQTGDFFDDRFFQDQMQIEALNNGCVPPRFLRQLSAAPVPHVEPVPLDGIVAGKLQPSEMISVKSFAQILAGSSDKICNIPINQLPRPCLKGDELSISIPEDEYMAGLEGCKSHLHGRLILSKGDTPIKTDALHSKLHDLWKPSSKWGLISLGKGYFEFSFSSIEDLRRIQSQHSWNCKPGLLRLFAWQPDFNPFNIKHTNVQCWIRLTGLSQEYWRPKILFSIASSVGTPICLDDTTSKSSFDRAFGHFARILVDVDLRSKLRNQVLVERSGYAFFVGIEYENLPSFCTHYMNIGHDFGNFNKLKHVGNNKEQRLDNVARPRIVAKYVPKENVSSNAHLKHTVEVENIPANPEAVTGINNVPWDGSESNPLMGYAPSAAQIIVHNNNTGKPHPMFLRRLLCNLMKMLTPLKLSLTLWLRRWPSMLQTSLSRGCR